MRNIVGNNELHVNDVSEPGG